MNLWDDLIIIETVIHLKNNDFVLNLASAPEINILIYIV